MLLHPRRKLARALDLVLEYVERLVEPPHAQKLYLIPLPRRIV